ncbi:MAG: glutaminyl-peptide cyclotransferase [Panacagrimonas sp.]
MRLPKKVNQVCRVIIALMTSVFVACAMATPVTSAHDEICKRRWRLLETRHHEVSHFTQGLLIEHGRMYESTGLYGASAVHEIELNSGRVLHSRALPRKFFGEGLAAVGNKLVQMTWREQRAFMFDLDLNPLGSLAYEGEAWGLTTMHRDGQALLLMSDGSNVLRWLDANTLHERHRIQVRERGRPVTRLNELEMMGTELLANIWHEDRVLVIDPDTGTVRAWFDFAALRTQLRWPGGTVPPETDLNGLAYDATTRRLFVTGKRWPLMFVVEPGACAALETKGN